ncbi:MAG: type IX secretion system sortase PorU [Paludibacteraceae bacterium]|nr:type IX secretion system sortase PorU [Paludibacteraceae bacterium]
MKRIYFLLLTLLWACAGVYAADKLFTYAENSVLQHGKWVKISVEQTGVHKLTYQDLVNMGFDNPANIRVYGYGGAMLAEHFTKANRLYDDLPEVSIYMEKGADGVFGADDYILFYAQGPVKVEYNKSNRSFQHKINPYSTKGYYFLTTQEEQAKQIAVQPQEEGRDTVKVNTSYNYYYHEEELVNLLKSGREWYGHKFTSAAPQRTFTFNVSHIASKNLFLNVSTVGQGEGMHKIVVNLGQKDYNIMMFGSSNTYVAGVKGNIKYQIPYSGASPIQVSCTYQPPFSSSNAYLDFIGISVYQYLRTDNAETPVFYPDLYATNTVALYQLYNQRPSVQVWDITDPVNVNAMPTSQQGDTLQFVAAHLAARHFMAVQTTAYFPTPQFVANVPNQNLHAMGHTDMVIIAPDEYVEPAEKLAQHHRSYDGMTVQVVTPQTIYNEFSSGTPDVTAYRWLMKMLYDRADNPQNAPKHLLFMGVAYYDNRGLKHPVPNMLSYQSQESLNETASYVTDDYYGLLEDGEGNLVQAGTLEIGVGRFPVSTQQEAYNCVDKTIRYVTQSAYGDWRNTFAFLADDEDANLHMKQANALADTLRSLNASFEIKKIWLDAYPMEQQASGSYYPMARDAILRSLQEGVLVFTYVGHGGPNHLTSERTIGMSDITYMVNNNLALWITATCDFSRYDSYEKSAGVEVILNPRGGAVASFTTTRVVYSTNNNNLAQALYHELIPAEGAPKPTLGEVSRLAKKRLQNDVNKLNFSLLGDPAITLHYPQQKVVTDSINGQNPKDATMPALGLITVKASVRDMDNNVDETFQGVAHVVLYDKEEMLKTLSGKGNAPFEYTNYTNVLFNGNVNVVDGRMEFTFMIPKDINYAIGNGRLVYYLTEAEQTADAHGHNHEFNIGGTASDINPEQKGPVIRPYLNTPNFVNGQKVNSKPVLYAHMYDEYGINTVGSGIGHDITLRLSSNPKETIKLNGYYEASLGDYRSGVLRYPLNELPEGHYIMELKAWNLQNISTTAVLDFVVEKELKPSIESFSIYPNPIKDIATLSVQYDRPADVGEITFFVYDLAGCLYWQSNEVLLTPDGHFTTQFAVNGTDGIPLNPGLYLAVVRITTSEGISSQSTKKIVVVAQ